MDYEIIATLGPASSAEDTCEALIGAGASTFRLNTSHLSLNDLQGWLERLERFFIARGSRIPLVLDLQGSKWRLGSFSPFTLRQGERVRLVEAEQAGSSSDPHNEAGMLPVPHGDFFRALAEGGEVVLNDARIRLRAAPDGGGWAEVLDGGLIEPRKGITLAGGAQRAEALSRKDLAIIAQVQDRAQYAISYIRDGVEMKLARRRCWELLDKAVYLIAKLERETAVGEARDIAAHADALWLCRGDLGAEMGLAAMAAAARQFSAGVASLPVPVVIAGQVLEHMTISAAPTRSEVCYLHDCLAAGYHGLVLSDETATGRYPVESVRAAAMFREKSGHMVKGET